MRPMNLLIQLVALVAIIHHCHGFCSVNPYQIAYEKVLQTKPNECRQPNPETCKCRKFSLQEPCLVERWVFHPLLKTCEPYCLEDNHVALDMLDLPTTRRECEDLCGDPCIVTYPNGTDLSELGVCMGDLFCDIFHDKSWWQILFESDKYICKSSATRCCPRDYLRSSEIPDFLKP